MIYSDADVLFPQDVPHQLERPSSVACSSALPPLQHLPATSRFPQLVPHTLLHPEPQGIGEGRLGALPPGE